MAFVRGRWSVGGGGAVKARPRAGLDCERAAGGGDHDGGVERSGHERVVPGARRVPGAAQAVALELHGGAGGARGSPCESAGDPTRPQAHQGMTCPGIFGPLAT